MKKPLLRLGVLCALATAACSDAAAPNGTVDAVVVAPAGASLLVGDTTRLVAAALDADGDALLNQTIEWATSDPSVATVSDAGLITAIAAGSVAIYAASGTHADSAVVDVVQPLIAAQLVTGYGFTCSLDSQGTAFCWGTNSEGQLGANLVSGYVRRATPVAGGLHWSSLAVGFHHACGLTTAGAAYCWGDNILGEVGDSTRSNYRVAPTAVLGPAVTALALGYYNSCGITVTGVRCWGSNYVSGYTGSPSLLTLGGGYFHLCGLVSGGQAFCWGSNYHGAVGDGSQIDQALPVPVAGGLLFTALSSNDSSNCGIVPGGAAYCWGYNFFGQVGDGSLTDQPVPVAVTGGRFFSAISTGGAHTCGISTQGLAYCWGNNRDGELGDGSGDGSAVPVAVAGGLRFSRISAGGNHTCGITVSGRVYCWGSNNAGQLGDGTAFGRLTPVPAIAP